MALEARMVEACGAYWDRGALVAVDPADRPAYAASMARHLAPGARMLLVALEYEVPSSGERAPGPPFPVFRADLEALYGGRFRVSLLEERQARRFALGRSFPAAHASPLKLCRSGNSVPNHGDRRLFRASLELQIYVMSKSFLKTFFHVITNQSAINPSREVKQK